MSKQKILISGCGLSFSEQERKVWTNILKIAGANIIDVSGPAVSNQWILDSAFVTLLSDHTITDAIIQLTNLGKLDVDIMSVSQKSTLVDPDILRNFTYKGIWPGSTSQEHLSKKLWYEYLYSPRLEQQELFCKIMLLDNWCDSHDIKLNIMQGYKIPWTDLQLQHLRNKIYNLDYSIWEKYEESEFYTPENGNTVPNLNFQFELALEMANKFLPMYVDKINYIRNQFKTV